MNRPLVVVAALAVMGIGAAVAIPVLWYARMEAAESRAAAALIEISTAQRLFRSHGLHGGYATDLASLRAPCPGDSAAPLAAVLDDAAGYTIQLRTTRTARILGADCHGRPMASDYYAAAQPTTPLSGRLGLATTARARLFVFFDGLPPLESDMTAGGLAVPLDTLDTFKIP